MFQSKILLRASFVGAISLLPAACAQPSGQSGMPGMDMQTMMNQCADMRRQMAQGTHQNTPDMNQTMAQCDSMDRGMGSMPGAGAAAPAATRSR